jgi:hypothetical protein
MRPDMWSSSSAGRFFRQAKIDVVERDVGRQLLQAAVGKPEPGAHGAPAMRQGQRVIEPGAPDGQIGVVDLGEGLSLPGGGWRIAWP